MREECVEADGQGRRRAAAALSLAARHFWGDAPMDGDARPWERRLSNLWLWKGLA